MALTKQAAIKTLYKEGWQQKDIAKILKLSEKTISDHVRKGNMKQDRIMQSVARNTSEENALIALEHQSTIIRKITEKLKEDLSDDPSMEDLQAALIPKGEIDALQKLFTTIKGKEQDWSNVVKIIREFTVWLKATDVRLAQEIIDQADTYLNEKRRVMS